MQSITVFFRDGSKEEFPHRGRSGGSYTKTIRYEGEFVIITDEYGNDTAFPACHIERVKTEQLGGCW